MDSYIVRVYRNSSNDLNEVAGLVESVGTNEKLAFRSFSDLVIAVKQAIGGNDMSVVNKESPTASVLYKGGRGKAV